tara:strand:+ start:312 stop:1589 length:1278 start_codon:yes stop_codon:yes gene_type:complete
MQQIDRLKRGPKSHIISTVDIITPNQYTLSSGVPLYAYKSVGIGAIRLEIVFEAGRLYETKRLVAQSCASLITEGSLKMTSSEISEAIDYEGAYLSSQGNSDFITLRLTCAKKSLKKVLPILKDIIVAPTFSEEELNIYKNRRKQRMTINLTKNDILSYRAITESLYGKDSVYGYNSTFEMLDDITSSDLKSHYNQNCTNDRAHIFLSGDYGNDDIKSIENLSLAFKNKKNLPSKYQATKTEKQTIQIKGRENQSSLKLALPLFNRNHKNYPGIYFLNTILGGYFGSRLMKNIREEKGYTYNIYSMLDTYKYDGSWIISCELDNEYVNDTLEQISCEFDKLKTEPLSNQELQMVKNYLLGNFMSTINGPFKAINPVKMQTLLGLESTFYNQLSQEILAFESDEIQSLAREYLNIDNFWKVIVGKA